MIPRTLIPIVPAVYSSGPPFRRCALAAWHSSHCPPTLPRTYLYHTCRRRVLSPVFPLIPTPFGCWLLSWLITTTLPFGSPYPVAPIPPSSCARARALAGSGWLDDALPSLRRAARLPARLRRKRRRMLLLALRARAGARQQRRWHGVPLRARCAPASA